MTDTDISVLTRIMDMKVATQEYVKEVRVLILLPHQLLDAVDQDKVADEEHGHTVFTRK